MLWWRSNPNGGYPPYPRVTREFCLPDVPLSLCFWARHASTDYHAPLACEELDVPLRQFCAVKINRRSLIWSLGQPRNDLAVGSGGLDVGHSTGSPRAAIAVRQLGGRHVRGLAACR